VPILDNSRLVGLVSRKDIISFAFRKTEITYQA
jgi:hypothetical protein